MYYNEDDFWGDYYDAQDKAEADAMRLAESYAELWEFDTEAERDEYIDKEYVAELERLTAENDRYFRACKKGR